MGPARPGGPKDPEAADRAPSESGARSRLPADDEAASDAAALQGSQAARRRGAGPPLEGGAEAAPEHPLARAPERLARRSEEAEGARLDWRRAIEPPAPTQRSGVVLAGGRVPRRVRRLARRPDL